MPERDTCILPLNVADVPPSALTHGNAAIRVPAALIIATVIARLFSLQWLRPLNWDEIEFFRATDWVRQGLVPYRDFWEHHTSLQWFLFAPVAAMTHSPGVSAIIAMRWAQLPLWIAVFLLINSWMRDAGIGRWPRWAATAVPLASSFFMLPAVEYRVDVLGIALVVLGLVLVQRMPRGASYAFAAGAVFALAGFANLRLGPMLVLAMLLARVVDLRERRWGGNAQANWIFAGAASTTAACSLYFVATGSLRIAVQRLLTENFITDRLQANVPGMFIQRIVSPFGVRYLRPEGSSLFGASAIDPGGILLVVIGMIALVRALARWRRPDDLFFLGFVEMASLLFTAAMKFVFAYHMEAIAVFAVPLIAVEIERFVTGSDRRRRAAVAALILAAIMNVAVTLFRGKEDDLRYQDFIMQAVDRSTPPGSTVFDGTGWALHRKPAYRYWFLRNIAHELESRGMIESYRVVDVLQHPPAAVIADHDLRVWIGRRTNLGRAIVAHYLPFWRDLWLPGLSAPLAPAAPAAQWIVPADGDYRIFASPRLAAHPWFRQPLDWNRPMWHDREVALAAGDRLTASAVPMMWSIYGRPAAPQNDVLHLRKGETLAVFTTSPVPVGVMLVRGNPAELFLQPPAGVTLEASASPRWHIPRF